MSIFLHRSGILGRGQSGGGGGDGPIDLPAIAHWTMDNVSGSTLVDEMGTYNGTMSGVSQDTSDYIEGSASLDFGSGDYVDFGNVFNFGANPDPSFSIAMWLKPTTTSGDFDPIFCKQNYGTPAIRNWIISINTSGYIGFIVRNPEDDANAVRLTPSAVANEWAHFVFVYDASTPGLHIYRNGSPYDGTLSGTVPTGIYTSSLSVRMGRFVTGSGTSQYQGKMDDVYVWDSALSAAQVSQLYDYYGV